ncbi:transglycosylase SLT domain-containing protein [Pararhizobium haloflavum]|uniref:transglycosylase SLT domain-containing protein n=1 Tax=Pararhizobium haloflavum TaxID=2037914 RepID=UPI000C177565|nr:transglycosylase SLT domain-containing protein [Pararhizobium haloflavum]
MSAVLLTASISSTDARAAGVPTLCEVEIAQAAAAYDIPEGILYSVGLTETGRRGSLHPFALNIEGKAVFAHSKAEALAAFADAQGKGRRLIDLGCMQINHHYHHDRFASVADMLDPRQNVRYAARFLSELKARHESWTMAVARYHAGPDNDPAQKRYVCRVISNLVATGYGQWTANARAFCGVGT